jgi:hypothetical protein
MITILMVYTVVMVLDMFDAGLQEIHWPGEVSMDRTALRIYVRGCQQRDAGWFKHTIFERSHIESERHPMVFHWTREIALDSSGCVGSCQRILGISQSLITSS